ncbi:CRISPR system CMR subunit Cmr7 1 [Bienertia sinuspersici]
MVTAQWAWELWGVLLSVVALDENNEMFPIAWGIVSGEDEDNWKFFIWNLKHILEHGDRGEHNFCIISDWHKAIDKACPELWPGVGKRYYTKNLSVNFKKMFPGPKIWQLFWLTAGAYSDFTFEKAMKQIDKHKLGVRPWLANLGEQERWSKHKFNPNLKSDVNKTNFVENFNATLGIDRTKPILTLLKDIN